MKQKRNELVLDSKLISLNALRHFLFQFSNKSFSFSGGGVLSKPLWETRVRSLSIRENARSHGTQRSVVG